MVNEDGKIIVKCPICKIDVLPHSSAELVEWFPRHCAVSNQCATGDVRDMVEEFERSLKEVDDIKSKFMKQMMGDKK